MNWDDNYVVNRINDWGSAQTFSSDSNQQYINTTTNISQGRIATLHRVVASTGLDVDI
jgi:hypothetical protein